MCIAHRRNDMAYEFIMHLVQKLVTTDKVNLRTHTPVVSIEGDENGSFLIKAPWGQMHAKQVILANNAYVSGLLP